VRTRTRRSPAGVTGHWIRPKKRAAIYERDGGLCAYCLKHPEPQNRTLDHLNAPRDNRPCNLVTVCRSCNSRKKGMGLRRWLRRLRERGHDVGQILAHLRRVRRRKLPSTPRPAAATGV